MKKGSTFILRGAILVIGGIVLALCVVVLPRLLLSGVGYYAPILIGMYVPAVPFFFALYQSLVLLRYIDQNTAFSAASVTALKYIRNCAFVIAGLYAVGTPYIFHAADRDDAPGVVAIGLVIIFASFVIAVFAAVLERLLKNAIEIKAENELTV